MTKLRIRLSIVAFAFTVLLSAAPANAQLLPTELEWGKIGISGGATLERIDDLRSTETTASFEKAIGYHVGLSYDQPIGPVYVRPGFVFRRVGAFTFPSSFEGPGHTLLEGQTFDVWTFEIPVDVRYQYDLTGNTSIYGFAGPMLSIPRAEADFDLGFRNAALAADLGFGAEFELPNTQVVLAPELRYSYSITNTVKDDFQLRGHPFSTGGLNANGPSFRLHVFYQL